MAYYLDYSTLSGKYLSIPDLDILDGVDFEIEFESFFNDTAFFRPFGTSLSFNSRVLFAHTAAGNYIRLTNHTGTSVEWSVSYNRTEFNKFKFVRVGSVVELFINGISQGIRTLSGRFLITRFFDQNGTASVSCGLRYFKFTVTGTVVRNYVNTTGTGTIWNDAVSGNNAVQIGTWPTNDSEWVFYDAGGGASQHQSSGASALQLCSAVATTSSLNSQQQNTGASAAQVFNAAGKSEPVNGQQQQTAGSAAQKFSAAATALPLNRQQHQTTATAAQAFTATTQTTASNNQHKRSTGQVVSVAGFIASTSWVNAVNLGNVQNRQTSASATQAFSAQATVTTTNKQQRQSGGKASAATTFAASSSWVNTVLQIAAYTRQIKTRSISKKHYQTSTRHSYHIKSRSKHKIELTTQSGGVYMQEINFKQGASALLVIEHQIDNAPIAGINAAKYELYGRTGQVLFTKELGSGIAFTDGKIEIQLTDTDTAELSGNYNHQCVAKDLADRTFYPLNGDITFSATKPRL